MQIIIFLKQVAGLILSRSNFINEVSGSIKAISFSMSYLDSDKKELTDKYVLSNKSLMINGTEGELKYTFDLFERISVYFIRYRINKFIIETQNNNVFTHSASIQRIL